jgi:hypothetical protein
MTEKPKKLLHTSRFSATRMTPSPVVPVRRRMANNSALLSVHPENAGIDGNTVGKQVI